MNKKIIFGVKYPKKVVKKFVGTKIRFIFAVLLNDKNKDMKTIKVKFISRNGNERVELFKSISGKLTKKQDLYLYHIEAEIISIEII